jgi:hypothetical protein
MSLSRILESVVMGLSNCDSSAITERIEMDSRHILKMRICKEKGNRSREQV